MKISILLLTLTLLAGCSSPTDEPSAPTPDTTEPAVPAPSTAPAPAVPAASTASATGVVETIDPTAQTVTIAHGPVAALQWPAMTMTFKAPDVDLSTIKQGDQVAFEFTANGMDGSITKITRQ